MPGSYKSVKKGMRESAPSKKYTNIAESMHQGELGNYKVSTDLAEEMHQGQLQRAEPAHYFGAAMHQGMSGAGSKSKKVGLALSKHIPSSEYDAHHNFGGKKGRK